MCSLATTMYLYIKLKRNATTFMQVKPSQALVEKHVEGLGFKLTDKGKKTSTILLTKAKANDYRLILALAHYSLRLSSVFVFEQCFAYLIYDHFMVKQKKKESLKVQDLYDKGSHLAEIFRSEHILIDEVEQDTFE